MNRSPKSKLDHDSWASTLGDHLPEDWEVSIHITHGELEAKLISPYGDEVEDICDDDLDFDEMLMYRVDIARQTDGLGPIFNIRDPEPELCKHENDEHDSL